MVAPSGKRSRRRLGSTRSAAIVVLLSAAGTGPALAVCPVCNAAVRLDSALALCFQQRVEGELRRLESEGRGFIIVDLSDCDAEGRGGLPIGTASEASAAALDASFVADGAGLRCLGEAIAGHEGKLEPSVVFDLTKICS